MFTDRFNELLSQLGVESNTDFAPYMECSRSYVSLLRSGRRNVYSGTPASARAARGLYRCALDTGQLDAYCKKIGCTPNAGEADIAAATEAWLLDGEPPRSPKKPRKKRDGVLPTEAAVFAKRFDAVMDLTELSNARLAQLANVDASVVSRLRRGRNIPSQRRETIEWVCRILYQRVCSQNNIAGISALMGVEPDVLENEDDGFARFKNWLLDSRALDATVIQEFLTDIDAFSPDAGSIMLSREEAVGHALCDTSEKYRGLSGLQNAVLRFLGSAIENGARELWLYSDQSMDWMTADRSYTLQWVSLMRTCINAGIQIKIIHNIDRGLEEMTAAIRSWMPLYMSGMIEGWYDVKNNGNRFSHTIFLAPNCACITASHVVGRENTALYRYDTDKETLDYYCGLYEALLSDCRPLIQVRLFEDSRPRLKQIYGNSGVHLISPKPSLCTMPETLLHKLMGRLNPDEKKALAAEWENGRKVYKDILEHRQIYEYILLPKDAALDGDDIPVDTESVRLSYAPEDYVEHIKNAIALSDLCTGYHLIALSELPFENIKILITGKAVTLRHLSPPKAAFVVTHPLMRTSFISYADHLKDNYALDQSTLLSQFA